LRHGDAALGVLTSLPNLLRRYGMEEEEEYVPQPV